MSLLANVSQLLKEPVGSIRALEVDDAASVLERGATTRLKGVVRLTRTGRGVWASGTLTATVDAECSRCLVTFSHWVDLPIDDEYLPALDPSTGARPKPAEVPDESFVIDGHHTLDLEEAVRQYLFAVLPLQPLCRPDCLGLCQQCGADLNEGPCGCEAPIDPRWEPLSKLLAAERSQ